MKRNDFYLIIILLLLTAGIFFVYNAVNDSSGLKQAVIFVNGSEYTRVDLPVESKKIINIEKNQHKNIIIIYEDTISMQFADCKDQLCVKQGQIKNVGQTIVCLPNKIVIEIRGKEEPKIDAVSN